MMQNDIPTTETAQNPPEQAGAVACPDDASLEEKILTCADYTYLYRRQAVVDAAQDEEKFRAAFKDFQKSAFNLSRHARAIQRCCEDAEMRISAIEILDRVKYDVGQAVLLAQGFEEAHVKAEDFVQAAPIADLKLAGIHLFDRINATLERIKNGKDADLAIRKLHEKAIETIAPLVKHTFEVTKDNDFSPFYTYPVPLPPEGEPLPDFPAAFVRCLLLPPEDMGRYPNKAFKIPDGYRDPVSGEDLTHLWDIDWERGGLVTSGPTEEETAHGSRQWICWCREKPSMVMPPECERFYEYHLKIELGLLPPHSPS